MPDMARPPTQHFRELGDYQAFIATPAISSLEKERRPLVCTSGPKSREETPKEGMCSSAAPQQYATAAHKAQVLFLFSRGWSNAPLS
jgi:hypothetical protein